MKLWTESKSGQHFMEYARVSSTALLGDDDEDPIDG